MANAHRVVFASLAEKRNWAAHDRGHFMLFPPFAPVVGDEQIGISRKDILHQHSLKANVFMVTVFSDSCPRGHGRREDFICRDIVEELKSKFGSWFLVIFGEWSGANCKGALHLSNRREFERHMAVADLHVSLTSTAFATDVSLAKSFGVPVLMGNDEDGMTPATSEPRQEGHESAKPLQRSLAKILSLSNRERSAMGAKGRLAMQAFLAETRPARMSGLLARLRRPKAASASPGPKIGIFIQLFDMHPWKEVKKCVQTVLEAAVPGTVDLIVTATMRHQYIHLILPVIRQSAPASLQFDILSYAEDRGADNGVFLQQLLLAKDLLTDNDIILKLHCSGGGHQDQVRNLSISDLCGSIDSVRAIIDQFKDPVLGMVGPTNLTWSNNELTSHVAFNLTQGAFDSKSVQRMKEVWSLMSEQRFPPRTVWNIVFGSFYWVRANLPVWEEDLVPWAPVILDACKSRKKCLAIARGLERLLPTLVATTHKVVAVPVSKSWPT
ncbi:unnamed protein product [Durusdinium trenchii]